MMNTSGGREAGISLLETMMAITVLSVSLLGLAQLLALAVQQNNLSRSGSLAVAVAQGKLEELRAAYYQELATGTSSPSLSAGDHGPETVVLGPPPGSSQSSLLLSVTWNVTLQSSGSKTVSVTVTPPGVTASRPVNITTHFSP